ncbi:hypothetical protein GQ42DRAFT_67506 [Ramicandelaber brevisporus]|nr:hypothetical protein GQ42DRAFT_67506 [Ramicandelaber brevisporus]
MVQNNIHVDNILHTIQHILCQCRLCLAMRKSISNYIFLNPTKVIDKVRIIHIDTLVSQVARCPQYSIQANGKQSPLACAWSCCSHVTSPSAYPSGKVLLADHRYTRQASACGCCIHRLQARSTAHQVQAYSMGPPHSAKYGFIVLTADA